MSFPIVASELDHIHDYNRNYNRRTKDAHGMRASAIFESDLWKDANGARAGSNSETSSNMDFGFNASPPLPASSSASVLSVIREAESEVNYKKTNFEHIIILT